MIPQRNISLISNTLMTAGGRRIPEAVIERDYVLAWFLTGLAGHPLREVLPVVTESCRPLCTVRNYVQTAGAKTWRFRRGVASGEKHQWKWLRIHLLIVPAPGMNGANGHAMLSRRGKQLADDDASFESYRQAAAFPKELLHPAIADAVWIELARGNFDTAVFNAFKAVEEAVRAAGDFGPGDYGVDLMRRAFHPEKGPLTMKEILFSEREALMHLFAGAIGSYKNPHSHRTVSLDDHSEAQEMVLLASHLLRIVEARTKPPIRS